MSKFNLAIILAVFCFTTQNAWAGPASCALAIKGCVGGGKDVAVSIKKSRAACKGLRDCKKVCKIGKKEAKQIAKAEKKHCKKKCKGKKGKSKRTCKKKCRKDKRFATKTAKKINSKCKKKCKAEYLTNQCRSARKSMIKKLTVKGVGCALKVSGACAAPAP